MYATFWNLRPKYSQFLSLNGELWEGNFYSLLVKRYKYSYGNYMYEMVMIYATVNFNPNALLGVMR